MKPKTLFSSIAKNWKTTVAGVPALAVGLTLLINIIIDTRNGILPTHEKMQMCVATLTTGVGLILAKDSNKTGV